MKKRVKICLFHFLCLMGLEGLLEMILFDHYMRTTLFSILFYTLPISLFISISTVFLDHISSNSIAYVPLPSYIK